MHSQVPPNTIDINNIGPSISSGDFNPQYSFEYTGRHDHGSLPLLKNRSDISALIASIIDVKAQCDSYLTDFIATGPKNGSEITEMVVTDESDVVVDVDNKVDSKNVVTQFSIASNYDQVEIVESEESEAAKRQRTK